MRWVVVDEADLLLTGSFQRDVRKILQSMREGDRLRSAEQICWDLKISTDDFFALPRHLRQRAYTGET